MLISEFKAGNAKQQQKYTIQKKDVMMKLWFYGFTDVILVLVFFCFAIIKIVILFNYVFGKFVTHGADGLAVLCFY